VPNIVQSSGPKDLIMPARTQTRKPTEIHVMMKKAMPTPQMGALLSPIVAGGGNTTQHERIEDQKSSD
jgi:hypothetical protein